MRVLAVRDRGAGPSASHKINVLTKIDFGSSLSVHFLICFVFLSFWHLLLTRAQILLELT